MTTNQKGSAWKHSMWILWTFTFVLNWVAFLYIGTRMKRPTLWVAGAVYATPMVLLFVLKDSAQLLDALALLLLGLVSIVHAFLVRPSYIAHVNAELEQKLRKYQTLQELIKRDQEAALTSIEPAPLQPPVEATATTASAPNQAMEPTPPSPTVTISTGVEPDLVPVLRPRTMTQRVDDFVLEDVEDTGRQRLHAQVANPQSINLNTATAEEIGGVPGIGQLLGMRAVSIRETQGRFISLEQFVDAIGLKPHVADRIRPHVTL